MELAFRNTGSALLLPAINSLRCWRNLNPGDKQIVRILRKNIIPIVYDSLRGNVDVWELLRCSQAGPRSIGVDYPDFSHITGWNSLPCDGYLRYPGTQIFD